MHRARTSVAISLLLLVAAACEPVVVTPSPEPSAPVSADPTTTPTPVPPTRRPDESGPPGVPEAVWTRLTPVGPPPPARFGHSWTVDPSAGLAYLFGGRAEAAPFDDLWVYDQGSDSWSAIATLGPRPGARSGHVAGWIDGLGLIIIGGRDADGTALADAWRFDPDTSTWTELSVGTASPAARSGGCTAIDPSGGLWLSHGLGEGPLADTWRFDATTSRWIEAPPTGETPTARSGAICWWTAGDGLALLGGSGSAGSTADAWILDDPATLSAEWTRAPIDASVAGRTDAAVVRHGDAIIVMGGIDAAGSARNDVVRIDLATLALEPFWTPSTGPTPRSGATLADDPAAERVLLFGGTTSGITGASDELWQLDP